MFCFITFSSVSFFNSLLSYFRSFSHFPPHVLRPVLIYCRISSSFELSIFKMHLYSTHSWTEHSDQYAYSLHFIHANKHVEVHVCSSGIANTFTVYSKSGLCHLQHIQTSSNSSTIAADSSNGVVTNTRCCRYSCMRSWWWVEVSPETCRAVSRYK
jgi:hypothetical protein